MNCIAVNENFSVSGPIDAATEQTLTKMGIHTLINLRPDAEFPDRSSVPDWHKIAMTHHWDYFYLPVTSGKYSKDAVCEFASLLTEQHGRVHVFCRTGTRALHMWLLAQQLNGDSFENLQAIARRFHVTMPVIQ